MRARRVIGNAALFVVSTMIALVACEFVARFFLHPIDYLKPPMVRDEIVDHRIEPGKAGHDEWGFRNKRVPDTCDIVVIGDSQTYGIGAASTDAWPAALSELTGRCAYNMALGGYGPVQYYHLLEEKALRLKPSLVVVGLYYGNDMHEAFGLAYHREHWKSLRTPEISARLDSIRAAVAKRPPAPEGSRGAVGAAMAVRGWLAGHSVVYRAAVEASPIGRMLRLSQSRFAPEGDIIVLDDPASGIRTAFALAHRLNAIDLGDPSVRDGIRISKEVLRRMHDVAASNGVEFVVAIIPTKPRVYERYIEYNESLEQQDLIRECLDNERRIDATMKASFDAYGIRYVDTLPALQAAVADEALYPPNTNGHPNKNGYAVIARAVKEFVEAN